MTENTLAASRRAVILGLAGSVTLGAMGAAIAVPAEAADAETIPPGADGPDAYDIGYDYGSKSGKEIMLYHVARAWIDRWKAAGGYFGHSYALDGSVEGLGIGWCEYGTNDPDWTPRDGDDSPLEPHIRLSESKHCRGARKVLEAMLVLVPGLKDIVRECAAQELLAASVREA